MGWKGIDPQQWSRKAKDNLRDTFRESVQDMAKECSTSEHNGGFVPHKVGNLIKSVMVKIGTMPAVAAAGAQFSAPDIAAYQMLEIGDTAYIGWQANYAKRVNFGFRGTDSLGRHYNQAGRGFADQCARKWPQIVSAAAIRVRIRSGG